MTTKSHEPHRPGLRTVTRRHFFEQASFGIGGLALASLMDGVVLASDSGGVRLQGEGRAARTLQFTPRIKRVIYLFMAGAPSQIDLFDPKPILTKHDGQDIPEEVIKGERIAFKIGREACREREESRGDKKNRTRG